MDGYIARLIPGRTPQNTPPLLAEVALVDRLKWSYADYVNTPLDTILLWQYGLGKLDEARAKLRQEPDNPEAGVVYFEEEP